MENQYQPSSILPPQQPLPNATAVLVLGIVSIVTCFCYGLPGLVCGIIALVLGNKAMKMYKEAPELYTEGSFSNIKTGRICAIVGISLASLYIVVIIIYLAFIGTAILSTDWYRHLN